MGTRADFYVGRGKDAEWIGSIAFDGYEDGIPETILYAADEAMFRSEVSKLLDERDDATKPAQGWPWPWDTSDTTDCSYWFFDGKCWDVRGEWTPAGTVYAPFDKDRPTYGDDQDEDEFYTAWLTGKPKVEFPNMADKKQVTFGKRSGVMIIGG
jgi:hypothetical protein